MTQMAILQEVDKCMRCNGCVIACKREWKMKQETIGVMKVAYDQRLAIKSQKSVDMGPFLRFSCWHCPDPPCAKRCPKKAISKHDDGAVDVDFALCDPTVCQIIRPVSVPLWTASAAAIPRSASAATATRPARRSSARCAATRAGVTNTPVPHSRTPRHSQHNSSGYKSTLVFPGSDNATVINELTHAPMCVDTCPAKAMEWDTKANVVTYLRANYVLAGGTQGWVGNGSMYWASKKVALAPPKADPFVEDHLLPLRAGIFSSPLAKAAIVPTILVGGLMALSARRAANEEAAIDRRGGVGVMTKRLALLFAIATLASCSCLPSRSPTSVRTATTCRTRTRAPAATGLTRP